MDPDAQHLTNPGVMHAQFLPTDGITFTPGPLGLRFYHTHNRA
jgi:hypothetical protein